MRFVSSKCVNPLRKFFSNGVNVPIVLQMEAVECGAAAVAMILAYYGKRLPLDDVRQECGVTRDGSNAASMMKAARKYGLKVKGMRLEVADLEKQKLPAVVHWEFNHFVVLERLTETHAYLADPALGRRRVTRSDFNGSFTGIALLLEPGPDFVREDKRPPKLTQLLSMLHGAKHGLVLIGILSLLLTMVGFGVPVFTQIYVDNVIINVQADWRTLLLWGLVLMVLGQMVINYLRQRLLVNIRLKLSLSMLNRFVEHLISLPIRFFTQRGTGDLMTRVRLNDSVRMLLSDTAITAVLDIALVFIYLFLMVLYDLTLTGFVMLAAVINIITVMIVSRARVNQNALFLAEMSRQKSVEMGSLAMMETIKSSSSEDQAFSRWRGLYVNSTNSGQSFSRLSIPLNLVPVFASTAVTGLVLWIGGARIISGHMTVGMVMAFQSLQAAFLAPVGRLVAFCGSIQQAQGNIERINDVLRAEKERVPENPVSISGLEGRIELRDVSFGYSPTAPPLIKDLSVTIQPGSRIALVGPSGSGKSTIAKLIVGILSPAGGDVFFDGVNIKDVDMDILRRQIGIINQDTFLFAGSVRENLSLWDEEVPLIEIVRAAKDACIHDDISILPEGYDSVLAEAASNLSGGQGQRISIARALTHNPSILLLDEATSALDTVTEKIVYGNLHKRGCSTIIIAHRLSTIRNADEIIVLSKGAIVERGRHEKLMELNGVYASLVRKG